MATQYEAVGYGATQVGLGTKPAVLVVDFQLAFTDPRFPIGNLPLVHRALENTIPLLNAARARGAPVAKCYTAYHSPRDMPRWKVGPLHTDFYYGHPCTAMDPRIDVPSHDFNFCKNTASMFFHTPLITFLAKHQVDTVIITGCTTSGCVRASIVDAFSYGFRVQVAEDCCGDAEEGPHNDTMRDVGRRYADITNSKAMIEYLSAR